MSDEERTAVRAWMDRYQAAMGYRFHRSALYAVALKVGDLYLAAIAERSTPVARARVDDDYLVAMEALVAADTALTPESL